MANGNGFNGTLTWRAIAAVASLLMIIILGAYGTAGLVWCESKDARKAMTEERRTQLAQISQQIKDASDASKEEVKELKNDIMEVIRHNEDQHDKDLKEIKRLLQNRDGRHD